jgi:hypothetical protein
MMPYLASFKAPAGCGRIESQTYDERTGHLQLTQIEQQACRRSGAQHLARQSIYPSSKGVAKVSRDFAT